VELKKGLRRTLKIFNIYALKFINLNHLRKVCFILNRPMELVLAL